MAIIIFFASEIECESSEIDKLPFLRDSFSKGSASYSTNGNVPFETISADSALISCKQTFMPLDAKTMPNGRPICPNPPTIHTSYL